MNDVVQAVKPAPSTRPAQRTLPPAPMAGSSFVPPYLQIAPNNARFDWVLALRIRLEDERNEDAYDAIRHLTGAEGDHILADFSMRRLAVKAFDDDEMAHALMLMPGALTAKLEWLRAEDAEYDQAVEVIGSAPPDERPLLYDRDDLRDWFVHICNDRKMRSIVLQLGGPLRQQLRWLRSEGTNLALFVEVVARTPFADRAAVLDDPDFVGLLEQEIPKDRRRYALDIMGGPISRQMELRAAFGIDEAPGPVAATPTLDARDVQLLDKLESHTALFERYEAWDATTKKATTYAAVAGTDQYQAFLPEEAESKRKGMIAELAATGFYGPPDLALQVFLSEVARFQALFTGFGLQTAMGMLADNKRIAEQERGRYATDGPALLKWLEVTFWGDKYGQVAVATNPGSVVLYRSMAGTYPILAHPAFYTPEMAGIVNRGDPSALAAFAGKVADKVLDDIDTAKEKLLDDTDKLWQLDGVIAEAKQLMGIVEGSVFDRIIARKLAQIHADETFRSILLGALAIGFGLLTGGTGAVAVIGAAGVAAISVTSAVQSWRRYTFTAAAHGSAIDPARALSQVEPSMMWFALDILGACLDLGFFAKAVKELGEAARLAVEAGELGEAGRHMLQNKTEAFIEREKGNFVNPIVSNQALAGAVVHSAERHAARRALLAGEKNLATELRTALVDAKLGGMAADDDAIAGLVSLGADTARLTLRGFVHEPELLARLATLAASDPVLAIGLTKLHTGLGDAAFETLMRDALQRRDVGRATRLADAMASDRLSQTELAQLAATAKIADPATRARALAAELDRTLAQTTGLHAPGSQAESLALERTRALDGPIDNPAAQLADEWAYVEHSKPLPVDDPEYVAEVALPNGHRWRKTPEGGWCRFSGPKFCLAQEGLTKISGRVTRAERQVQSVAPLDFPIYRINPGKPPDIVPPDVVLETADRSGKVTQRVWREAGESGGIVTESVVGPSMRRRHFERAMPSRGEMPAEIAATDLERAHPQASSTGSEARYAILLAPSDVNQQLQNLGIEEFLRELERNKNLEVLKDVTLHNVTVARRYPLTNRLSEIEYRIDLSSAGVRRPGFQVSIEVTDSLSPRVSVLVGHVSPEIAPFLAASDLAHTMRERFLALIKRVYAARAQARPRALP